MVGVHLKPQEHALLLTATRLDGCTLADALREGLASYIDRVLEREGLLPGDLREELEAT
jgi:hypothetical protein